MCVKGALQILVTNGWHKKSLLEKLHFFLVLEKKAYQSNAFAGKNKKEVASKALPFSL